MSPALTLTHRFGSFELPSYNRQNEVPRKKLYAPAILISDLIPSGDIRFSGAAMYRLTAEEHGILFSALKASVEIRATLTRE